MDSEDEFVQKVLSALEPAPDYYPRMKKINIRGPEQPGEPPRLKPLSADEVQRLQQDADTTILDTREIEAFGGAHIPGALNIPLRKSFPVWAGRMLDPNNNVALVLSDGQDLSVVVRHLWRTGIEKLAGFLRKGMRSWYEAGLPFSRIEQLSVHELRERLNGSNRLQVLDVRSDDEWQSEHIPAAQHIHLPVLDANLDRLDKAAPVAVYCGSGYRAGIGASLLKQQNFRDVYNVPGSMSAWQEADYDYK
jgi:hydroxyacylglutathione hydrolase